MRAAPAAPCLALANGPIAGRRASPCPIGARARREGCLANPMSEAFPPKDRAPPREREAQAVLRRVDQESGPAPQAGAEELDWAEHWGRRVGRVLSFVLTAAIVAWLALYVFGG